MSINSIIGNVKLNLHSFSLLRLISQNMLRKNISYTNLVVIKLDDYMINENVACISRGTKTMSGV
jgi:hypothetical protein